ncbi:MAG: hypothetical protein RIC85_04395 [Gammaproteobacteria bacterium]
MVWYSLVEQHLAALTTHSPAGGTGGAAAAHWGRDSLTTPMLAALGKSNGMWVMANY